MNRANSAQLLQSNAIQLWASFEQFKDVAAMYRQIYNPHLIKGLNLVDRMTRLPRGSDFATQLKDIDEWKESVQSEVDAIVEKVSPSDPILSWLFVQSSSIRCTFANFTISLTANIRNQEGSECG